MPRPKRNSSVLERAERRLESLRSINSALDLGDGLTVDEFSALINELADTLATYNTTLSTVDKMADDVKVLEKEVKIMAEKMLLGVGSRYGKSSQEYEMAGGTRRKASKSRKSSSTAISPEPEPASNSLMNGSGSVTTPV